MIELTQLLELRRAVEYQLQMLGYSLQYGEISLMDVPYAEVGFNLGQKEYMVKIHVFEREKTGDEEQAGRT